MKVTLPSGRTVEVDGSKDLRASLKPYWSELYHSAIKPIHCRGLGTCGTCAVKIEGELTPPTRVERWRLNFTPHKNSLAKGIRLACQCKPLSDIVLMKEKGKWGQG
jgi:ferredoxin